MTSYFGIQAYETEEGNILIDPKYYDEYIEKLGDSILEDKTKNFLVMLLGTTGEPIRGRTLIIKEAFLFLKSMKNKLEEPPDISFYPHRYGPYSRYVANKLKELQMDGVITIDGNKVGLNGRGHSVLEKVKKKYRPEVWNELVEFRVKLDQKGTDGIMKVVYEKFPDYTVNSLVRDKYVSKKKDECEE